MIFKAVVGSFGESCMAREGDPAQGLELCNYFRD